MLAGKGREEGEAQPMIEITPTLHLDESEITIDYVRASGPGGQNVNKVSTAAQLRFDVQSSPSLPEDVRRRLLKLAGNKLTNDGVLVIEAKQYRTQEQNRADALDRLVTLVRRATQKPKARKQTKPSAAAVQRRLEQKSQHSQKKKLRQRPGRDELG